MRESLIAAHLLLEGLSDEPHDVGEILEALERYRHIAIPPFPHPGNIGREPACKCLLSALASLYQ